MAKHIAKHSMVMGGKLIYGGSPIERSLIPEVFLKHFIGFDENGKPVKEAEKSNEQDAKDALEIECLALYKINLDKRKQLIDMKNDAKEAHDAFVANVIEKAKKDPKFKAKLEADAKAVATGRQ